MSAPFRVFAFCAALILAGLACIAQAQMLPLTGAGGASSVRSSGPYVAQGVHFDATTYMARGGTLTSQAASKVGIISFWLQMTGGDSAVQMLAEDNTNGANGVQIARGSANTVRLQGTNASTVTFSATTGSTFLNGGSWAHILCAWDSAVGSLTLYVNDVSDLTAGSTSVTDTIYSSTDQFFGARGTPTLLLNGNIADFYLNSATFLDMNVTANRRKFITAGLRPVDLGSDGSIPTSAQPIIYFSSSVGSWATNKGYGGGFSVSAGALSAAATNP